MSNPQNRHGSATITFPSATAYAVERRFDAPASKLFRAVTEPELIKRWWGFPTSEWQVCEVDLREGGRWRYVIVDDGTEVAFHGTFQEILEPERIVTTEVYEGAPGAGPDSEEGTLNSMTLTEEDGVTLMTTFVECHTPERREAIIASGMESGMQVSYDRMEDLVTGSAADTRPS
jgi:uncharacterized protein YndB with AHSA1/START domain